MSDWLSANPLFLAFLLSSLILALTPGPGVMYIVARTSTQGRRAGFLTVAGVAAGNMGNALGAALGLAMLFSVSSLAFSVVKLAGCLYLIYLGWQALRPAGGETGASVAQPAHASHLFRDGFLVALLNPKTTLFFAAFLPQFLSPQFSPLVQSLGFGACFVLIAACTDSAYVLASSALANRFGALREGSLRGRTFKGVLFIALGIYMAVTGGRSQVSPAP